MTEFAPVPVSADMILAGSFESVNVYVIVVLKTNGPL